MLKGRKGFTLVELVVALTLFGVCAAGVARLLTHFQRHHLRQVEQAEVRATLQTSAWLISRDLRELDVTDPLGSDLVAVSDSSLTYKAMRGVHFTCLPSALANPVVDSSALGLREADAQYDSVLVLATVAQGRESTDRWIHADLIGASAGSPCPGGRPGVQLALGVPEPGDSIPAGTPVRFFEMVQWRVYRDGSGDVWLGQQRRPKATGWSVVQPVAGPLTPPGLRLALVGTARDTAGPAAARAGLTLIILGKSSRPVWIGPDRPESLRDSVVVQVAFRNGLR